eukprot:CAMPEP_0171193466 /NCGR_PEP_ID=MMETSP0790-20130122/20393_1 /TAXON_ID=2925 /ORGANISM="Alexandrium catenella, Strain OF101" /LENGTH=487 /DNA_ID=CAMNT_0011658643 /DNA_START=171 /DNA_END=1634 /DNA_ORIENTATION=+
MIILVLSNIKTLGPDDQVVIHNLDGKEVLNGPMTGVLNPFRDKEWRKAQRLEPTQYVRIMDMLSGAKRVEEGPKLLFLNAYDQAEANQTKIVLKKDQYIRFVDRLTGTERVLRGPQTIVPGPWEESAQGRQQAKFVNRDSAVVVLNKVDGTQRLHTTPGVFFPSAYETVLEERSLIRVLPHETMVVRNKFGRYLIYSGAGGNATGTSFFLGPYDKLVEMEWSVFSAPSDVNPVQTITKETVTVIDMRVRKVEYQYEVRTNDNVNLRLQGTIFWKITDVSRTISMTDDPAGDVWHHARSALIQAVSKADLDTFMRSFNALVQVSFRQQAADGFYVQRGVEVQSMEVTKYDCVDPETAATLQDIIKETTNRINRLQAQRSENDVQFAKLRADIVLERQRTQLIQTQAFNERLAAEKDGEAKGAELAKSAATFIDGLNASLPSVEQRVDLYKLHKQLEHQNAKTKSLASGKATLFLTPQDMNLKLNPAEL